MYKTLMKGGRSRTSWLNGDSVSFQACYRELMFAGKFHAHIQRLRRKITLVVQSTALVARDVFARLA
jgi:hypothetical protein